MQTALENEKQKPKQVVFFIGKEKFSTDKQSLTVRELLVEFAQEDPTKTTLAKREGNKVVKFTNLDESIPLKNGDHFVVLHNEPTPVS